jgi:hypothetical protein
MSRYHMEICPQEQPHIRLLLDHFLNLFSLSAFMNHYHHLTTTVEGGFARVNAIDMVQKYVYVTQSPLYSATVMFPWGPIGLVDHENFN